MNLQDIISQIAKEVVKELMETIMLAEREVFTRENSTSKNGFYERSLKTLFGNIENMKIPRERSGEFRTQLFEPYKRSDITLEEFIFSMLGNGMSTRGICRT